MKKMMLGVSVYAFIGLSAMAVTQANAQNFANLQAHTLVVVDNSTVNPAAKTDPNTDSTANPSADATAPSQDNAQGTVPPAPTDADGGTNQSADQADQATNDYDADYD